MKCSDVMTKTVRTCHSSDTILQCARIMRDDDIGFLPVVDENGAVIGTITDRDLTIRGLALGAGGDSKVADLMTKNVVTCKPDDDLTVAEKALKQAQVSRIPVVDDAGRCMGVISIFDLARHDNRRRLGDVVEAVKDDGEEKGGWLS